MVRVPGWDAQNASSPSSLRMRPLLASMPVRLSPTTSLLHVLAQRQGHGYPQEVVHAYAERVVRPHCRQAEYFCSINEQKHSIWKDGQEHMYTADANEYTFNTTKGGWTGDGQVFVASRTQVK